MAMKRGSESNANKYSDEEGWGLPGYTPEECSGGDTWHKLK